ncbi:BOW99_gp33 family protein [Lacrimispora sp. 38-1]|uniref:BOW99_gp33 family protein n=1 Tax=Lacrimispora sp. 38-1 TaxID=3125778 RepID=UPI003CF16DC5
MEITVTHVMANGNRLKNIRGAVIPPDNSVYRIIAKMIEVRSAETNNPREGDA